MKRERTHRILHHFSFGERFDETMMNAYCVGNKYIAYTNHQFIGFLSTNKPAGGENHYPQAGRSDVRPARKSTLHRSKERDRR